jgi:sRNA-binding carbon storage regulator CsrA
MGLVITRRPGESIRLGTSDGEVWITWQGRKAGGSELQFLVEAPAAVTIHRAETLDETPWKVQP